jgi:hypothetical protein
MCIICTKEYDENTTELWCCENVTEIPFLTNLEELHCSNTQITEIPFLPKLKNLYCSCTLIKQIPILPELEYLYCYITQITEIPILPNLKYLHCSHTLITKLPDIKNCCIISNRCRWLDPNADTLTKIIKIQKLIKQHILKRVQIIHNAMYTHADLVHVLN